jgi:multidrug efflux pump
VHPQGKEGWLTAFVNRRFEEVRRLYARLLDGALQMRWGIVAAALLIMMAAWPLYLFSRQELAPVEDQSHISLFFEASPDSTVGATNREHLHIVKAITSFPETEFTWGLTTAWGGFGGLVAKDWHERVRSTEQMYGEVYGAVSQVPGLRVFPRLDPPPCRHRANTMSSWYWRAICRPNSCWTRSAPCSVPAGRAANSCTWIPT